MGVTRPPGFILIRVAEEGRNVIVKSKVVAIVLIVGFIAVLSGCCGGDTTTVEKQPVVIQAPPGASPTVGQELQSLDEAYKKGLITKDQYEEAKKKILDGAGK